MGKTSIAKKDPRDISFPHAKLTNTGIQFDRALTLEEWQGVGEFLERAEGAVQWWIGDWLNCGEGRPKWGDKYEQAISMFSREYSTLANYKWIAEQFKRSDRTENLSWTHHQAVASEPPAVRRQLLAEAEPEAPDKPPRLSVAELKKRARGIRAERETPALPAGKFRVLYADPPWKYNDERTGTAESGAVSAQYDLLDTDLICALHSGGTAIQDLPGKDAVLFLWATAPVLPDALRVMAAWGFRYKAQFVWNKVRGYNGHYNDVQHELLLIGIRGQCQPAEGSLQDSVITIEKTAHSAKPDEFYDIIESLYPEGPYVELFARRGRAGWMAWGNQTDADDD